MISYEPLWQTMKQHGATTYTLQAKAGISSSTIRRMQANESVSTNTLDTLCKFFFFCVVLYILTMFVLLLPYKKPPLDFLRQFFVDNPDGAEDLPPPQF